MSYERKCEIRIGEEVKFYERTGKWGGGGGVGRVQFHSEQASGGHLKKTVKQRKRK